MRLRLFKIYFAVSIISFFTLFWGIAFGNDVALERSRVKVAANIDIKFNIYDQLENQPLNSDALLEAMSREPELHVQRHDSKALSMKILRQKLIDWALEEIEFTLRQLDPNGNLFTSAEWEDYKNLPKEKIDRNMTKNFGEFFETVRKQVAESQYEKIQTVFPSTEELSKIFELPESDRHTAFRELEKQLLQKLTSVNQDILFEEVREKINKEKVRPVLEDARRQFHSQLQWINNYGSRDKNPQKIEKELKQKLSAYVQSKEYKDALQFKERVYGVFPAFELRLKGKVEDIATENLKSAIREMRFPVNIDNLVGIIKKNIASHKVAVDSAEIVFASLKPEFKKNIIKTYSKGVRDKGFNVWLSEKIELLEREEHVVLKTTRRAASDAFLAARKRIAEEQFSWYFSPLKNGKWRPHDQLVESFYNSYSIYFSDPMFLEGIKSKSFDNEILLAETEDLVLKKEVEITKTYLNFLKKQMQIIDDVAEKVKTSPPKEVKKLNDLIALLTKKVKNKWSGSRVSRHHSSLFPKSVKEIEKQARSILDLIARKEREKREEEERRKKEEEEEMRIAQLLEKENSGGGGNNDARGANGGGSGGGTGDGGDGNCPNEEKDVHPDLLIDIEFSGKSVKLKGRALHQGEILDKFINSNTCVNPDLFSKKHPDISRAIFQWLKKEVERQLKNVSDGDTSPIELFILARVDSGSVDYGALVGLRRCLVEHVIKIKKKISLKWYDDFFSAKEKKGQDPGEYRKISWKLTI